MNIAIVGPGRMGSTFAYHLSRAQHQVTVVGRGARLARLKEDNAIVTTDGERAAVTAVDALDPTIEYDVVLVTLFATQVDAVLPALTTSRAKAIVFMFNMFEPLERLRQAVGAERFGFAFPAFGAYLVDGKVKVHKLSKYEATTCDQERWAEMFRTAGMPAETTGDMQSWLRTHAAFVVPLMVMADQVKSRGNRGLNWSESTKITDALKEGMDVVQGLGNELTPPAMKFMGSLPRPMTTAMMWAMSRTQIIRDLAAMGNDEARLLIDQMNQAAPGKAGVIQSIRP
jgi:2-dehydropantoate 2-reductase